MQLRKANVPKTAAKKKAREFAERYQQIKSIKETDSLSSRDALLSAKRKDHQEFVAHTFKEITKHPLSSEEAEVIMKLYDFGLSKTISKRMGKPYTWAQFCLDYDHQRFIKGVPKPKSNDEAAAIMTRIGKMYGVTLSPNTLSAASAAMEFGPRKTTASISRHRFYREAERTNTLHKIENEQRIIMMELDQIVGNLTIGGVPFLRKLGNVTRELKRTPTDEEAKEIGRKIKGFNKKSEAVRQRIIQEKRAEEKLEPFIQAFEEHALMVKHALPPNGLNEWVLRSLKRPGNRRYLRAQLLEWFSEP